MALNIVVPLAGAGSRFSKNLWHQGKPMIDIAGKPMLQWVVENVNTTVYEPNFIFIARRDYEGHLERLIAGTGVEKYQIKYLDEVLQGAALTVLTVRDWIDNDTPIFVVNSDQYLEFDKDEFYSRMKRDYSTCGSDGFILSFEPEQKTTAWSYVELDSRSEFVTQVKEKVVLSDIATVGAYAWRTGRDFVNSALRMIDADDTTNGEFYVAPVYNYSPGSKYKVFPVSKMYGTGVPSDLVAFYRDHIRELPLKSSVRSSHPVRFIAHRGNTDRKDVSQENNPRYIGIALHLGYDVEVDAWCVDGDWFLGHDEPQYAIDYTFLLRSGLVVHAKNLAALSALARDERIHSFSHDHDDVVYTSSRILWTYPDKPLGDNSVAVMFSGDAASRVRLLDEPGVVGICADDVRDLRCSLAEARNVVNAVVFDLDGTLVETRDLHKVALNEALRAVAGEEYVISDEEHHAQFDGLSTAQKLKKLNAQKNMNPDLNKAVWEKKQELTNTMVSQTVKPDKRIAAVIRHLKQRGYPVAVASNCIRSSVDLILKCLGIYDLVDLSVSNDDVEIAKPAPDIYARAAACFGLRADELLVVEDAPFGWQAALSSGAHLMPISCPADVTLDSVSEKIAEINNTHHPVVVIVPLAGPIPLVHGASGAKGFHPSLYDIRGKSAIEHAMQSVVSRRHPMKFVFVVLGDSIPDAVLMRATNWLPTSIVRLPAPTRGALESVLAAERFICEDSPLLICDGCHVDEWRPGSDIDELLDARGCTAAVTVTPSYDERWSYATIDPDGFVSSVQEKAKISNHALTGLYMWRQGKDFIRDAKLAMSHGPRVRGRLYVAPVLNYTISSAGGRVRSVPVRYMHSLGTHSEVLQFALRNYALTRDVEFERVYCIMREKWRDLEARFTWNAATDTRQCVAAYTLATKSNFRDDSDVLSSVQSAFADHLIYTTDRNLHFTFLKLTKFCKGVGESVDAATFESLLYERVKQFAIEFKELIVTSDSVLMVGIPDIPVNDIRQDFRKYFPDMPQEQDICHATLVRFTRALNDNERAFLKSMTRRLAGVVLHVDEIRLASCDYPMLSERNDTIFKLS